MLPPGSVCLHEQTRKFTSYDKGGEGGDLTLQSKQAKAEQPRLQSQH